VVHYATHETLDVRHAEGFYAPLERLYAQDARARYQIEQGLELGGYVFGRLYDDLYAHRARRWRRALTGPHSVADGWWVDVD
jgi:pyrroloquinoline-quinone synthase